MNDSLLKIFLTDYRTYVAMAIGSASAVLSSRRVIECWPALRRRLPIERAWLALPFFILVCDYFLMPLAFDWSGEFAGGILLAFGFVFSLRLLTLRGWLYRGAGLLFAVFFAFNLYGTASAWISRANHGHPFR